MKLFTFLSVILAIVGAWSFSVTNTHNDGEEKIVSETAEFSFEGLAPYIEHKSVYTLSSHAPNWVSHH